MTRKPDNSQVGTVAEGGVEEKQREAWAGGHLGGDPPGSGSTLGGLGQEDPSQRRAAEAGRGPMGLGSWWNWPAQAPRWSLAPSPAEMLMPCSDQNFGASQTLPEGRQPRKWFYTELSSCSRTPTPSSPQRCLSPIPPHPPFPFPPHSRPLACHGLHSKSLAGSPEQPRLHHRSARQPAQLVPQSPQHSPRRSLHCCAHISAPTPVPNGYLSSHCSLPSAPWAGAAAKFPQKVWGQPCPQPDIHGLSRAGTCQQDCHGLSARGCLFTRECHDLRTDKGWVGGQFPLTGGPGLS